MDTEQIIQQQQHPPQHSDHPQQPQRQPSVNLDSDDEDRKGRFQVGPTPAGENGNLHHIHYQHPSLRDRAASQPPRSSDQHPFIPSPSQQYLVPSSLSATSTSPWLNSRLLNSSARTSASGLPLPVPIRSSSYSTHQAQFSSAMRDRVFPSTFEDDESEGLSDTYDDRLVYPSSTTIPNSTTAFTRGRTYAHDPSRSRSQSLAGATSANRQPPIGSPYFSTTPTMQSFNDSFLSTVPQPHRYGDIKPPGPSRYGSLGTVGRSPISSLHPSSPGGAGGSGFADGYNMSPFVRDLNQILLDDPTALRERWSGMNPPRDEAGGASGTTSRRHSVSVVQPRRNTLTGANAGAGPGVGMGSSALLDGSDDFVGSANTARPSYSQAGFVGRLSSGALGGVYGSPSGIGPIGSGNSAGGGIGVGGHGVGGLRISEDDLVADFSALKMRNSPSLGGHGLRGGAFPHSQPSSLPIYAPLSRSPSSKDVMSPFGSINLNIATTPSAFAASRQRGDSPSPRSAFDSPSAADMNGRPDFTGRFVTGQHMQYLPGQRTAAGGASTTTTATAIQRDVLNQNGSAFTRTRAPSYTGGLPSPISPTAGRIGGIYHHPYLPPSMQRTSSEAAQAQALAQAKAHAQAHVHGSDSPIHGNGISIDHSPALAATATTSPIRASHIISQESQRGSTSPTSASAQAGSTSAGGSGNVHMHPNLADLGKGLPLHAVPPAWPLYIVEFKAGRTDIFYCTDMGLEIKLGDLVIVEADRGKDLGKVINDSITVKEVEAFQKQQAVVQQQQQMGVGGMGGVVGMGMGNLPVGLGGPLSPGAGKKEINPKMIYGKAQQQDAQLLVAKMQDEMKALQLCQTKVKAKKLPMEVVDAEYQWDRRKLTFYFIADKRIDFRELVRELFRLYKTRIWMASLQGGVPYEQ